MGKFMKVMAVTCMSMAVLTGCGSKEDNANTTTPSGDTIKIGVNYEQTGGVAQYGIAHVEGLQMAVEEINAAGGVLGKQIELDILDNKSELPEVSSVSQKLAKDGVVAILGPATSGNTKQAFATAEETKIPTISASATDDATTLKADGSVTPYGFKTCYSDSFQGRVLANFADKKEFKNVLVMYDASSDYGKGLNKAFTEAYKGTVAGNEAFQNTDTDYNMYLTKYKDSGIDAIAILGYYEQAGLIVKQAREMGIEAVILGPDGLDDVRFNELVGEANLNDIYFTTHFTTVGDDPVVTKFIEDFKAKYDGATPGAFHALGYDEMYFLADAIERAGEATPEKIKEALENTTSFGKVTGTFSMGADHVAKKSVKVVELQGGKQVNAETVDPE